MLRRSRDGRARLLTWSETPQHTDAVAVIQKMDRAEWESRMMAQVNSDSEHEVDYLTSSPDVSGVADESFCLCHLQEALSPADGLLDFDPIRDCLCGEEDQGFEWVWDENHRSIGTFLSCDNRKVSFHSDYSCGTAAIRGTKELSDGQHFWEVKMTSPVYGTDMMVGIGSSDVNLEKFKYSFMSLLGHDEDSWGLSYTGLFHHKGDKSKFSSRFGHGSVIGVHLDTWHGTLTFYKNRCFIGVAATGLENKKFYPMVCSTAARSSMKVIRSCYTPTTLQYLCCVQVQRVLPHCPDVLDVLKLPPGLHNFLRARLGWIFSLSSTSGDLEHSRNMSEDLHEETSLSLRPVPCPERTLSAYTSPDLCPCPFLDTVQHQCCCQTSTQVQPCTCHCHSDYDSCSSEPEDYQCKRCRWI